MGEKSGGIKESFRWQHQQQHNLSLPSNLYKLDALPYATEESEFFKKPKQDDQQHPTERMLDLHPLPPSLDSVTGKGEAATGCALSLTLSLHQPSLAQRLRRNASSTSEISESFSPTSWHQSLQDCSAGFLSSSSSSYSSRECNNINLDLSISLIGT